MKRAIVSGIIITALVLAFLAGRYYAITNNAGADGKAGREVLYYTDPMNPGFRSEEPGIAPCGMPLEPVYAESEGDASISAQLTAGAVRVNAAQQQIIGVIEESVEKAPMNHRLRLYGKIVPDETKIYRINASTDSWVRDLSDLTTGSIVGKDQLLVEVLAPAFYNAQVTYLVAMDNLDRIKKQLGGDVRHQQTHLADNQIRVAVQALQNLGITDAQIEELANTRKSRPYLQVRAPSDGVVLKRNMTLFQWFKAGEEFYEVADLSTVWVYADVYEDEARYLWPGMEVKIFHKQLGKTFNALVSRVLPLFDPVAKTLKVRIDIDNPDYDLRPDMFVDVELPVTLPASLHVPADAVIDSGTRQLVYVDTGNRVFEPRTVKTGWRLGRRIEIVSGLMPGEKVVVSGNFLIDSESRMKTAAGSPDVAVVSIRRDPVCGMQVDTTSAEKFGRAATYQEETFYFCTDRCKKLFEGNPQKYAGEENPADLQKDPVCGMRVEVSKAEKSGLLTEYQDNSYYFCSENCRDAFKKEPGKFKAQPVDMKVTDKSHAPPHGPEIKTARSWLHMLMPEKGSHITKKTGTFPGQKMGRTIGTPAASSGVIDWNGPETDKKDKDWSGWGKFPGAEYLGLKNEKVKSPGRKHANEKTNKAAQTKVPKAGPTSHTESGSHAQMKSQDKVDTMAASGENTPHRTGHD